MMMIYKWKTIITDSYSQWDLQSKLRNGRYILKDKNIYYLMIFRGKYMNFVFSSGKQTIFARTMISIH